MRGSRFAVSIGILLSLAGCWVPVTRGGQPSPPPLPNKISSATFAKLKAAGIATTLDGVYPHHRPDASDAETYLPALKKLETPSATPSPAYFALAEKVARCKTWSPEHGSFGRSSAEQGYSDGSLFKSTLDAAGKAFEFRATDRAMKGDLKGATADIARIIQIDHLAGSNLTELAHMGEVNSAPDSLVASLLPVYVKNPDATRELFETLEATPRLDYRAFVRQVAGESLSKDIAMIRAYDASPHDDWDGGPNYQSLEHEANQWLDFAARFKGDPGDPFAAEDACKKWQSRLTQTKAPDLIYWPLPYDTAEGDIDRIHYRRMLKVAADALRDAKLPVPPKGSGMFLDKLPHGWRLRYAPRPNVASSNDNTLGFPRITFDGQKLEVMGGM